MLMPFVDCQPADSNPVTELVPPNSSSLNQQIYLRLRLALSLNLRRQIFIAVCDDVRLRDRFAAQLQADLANSPAPVGSEEVTSERINNATTLTNAPASPPAASRFVSLGLNLPNPDVLGQVMNWLSQHSDSRFHSDWVPGFQIVGVEALTRQPVHIQRAFLRSLQQLAKQLSTTEFNLVLWVSRPWCRSLQQVPEFWRWHTGVFEFEGDPAPVVRSGEAPRHQDEKPEREQPQNLSPKIQVSPLRSQAESELMKLVLASATQIASQHQTHPQSQALSDDDFGSQAVRLLQHIEELHRQQAAAATLSAAYRQLGDGYRDRIEQGDVSQPNLTIAIRAYEQALQYLESTAEVADLLNDIGNLYWMLSRCPTAIDEALNHLEKALAVYRSALAHVDPRARPGTFAMIQNNLGSAYSDLAQQQNSVENLQHAIAAYQQSLHYRQLEEDPSRYAATQNNLGTAYWNLAQHQQSLENLQHAVAAYSSALRYYNPEQEPLHYAMIQNNLGTAYWNLAQCTQDNPAAQLDASPEDLLLLAIGAYRIALMYRTLEAAPASYAATQNNLGTAYWHLANQSSIHYEDAEGYLHQAIAAYREALAAVHYLSAASTTHAPTLTFDHFSTHSNLGSAYYQLATHTHVNLETAQRSGILEAALTHHVQALQGWQEQPDFYKTALNGIVQTVRAFHDRFGIQGQTQALSKIPALLIPAVMKQL